MLKLSPNGQPEQIPIEEKTQLTILFNTELSDSGIRDIRELIEDSYGVEIISIDEKLISKEEAESREVG